jgi:hypothetical protein
MLLCALIAIALNSNASAQIITDGSDNVLSVTIPFGNLTPGTSTTPASTQVQFRLRSNKDNGYKVQASATFNVMGAGPNDGGLTVSASDIGVGITGLVFGPAVKKPRTDVIAPGFDYNPTAVSAVNGLTPYAGMALGQATLADILANPNTTILSGPKIANNQHFNPPANTITVTMTFGLVGQFFTPATLSGVLTLTIVDGP